MFSLNFLLHILSQKWGRITFSQRLYFIKNLSRTVRAKTCNKSYPHNRWCFIFSAVFTEYIYMLVSLGHNSHYSFNRIWDCKTTTCLNCNTTCWCDYFPQKHKHVKLKLTWKTLVQFIWNDHWSTTAVYSWKKQI